MDLANFEMSSITGNPVSGATVELYAGSDTHPPGGAALSSTITDSNGRWAFTGLAVGDYDIKITYGPRTKWYKSRVKAGVHRLTEDVLTVREQSSTPAAPTAGHNLIYSKNDGLLYQRRNGGNERRILAAGGATAGHVFKITGPDVGAFGKLDVDSILAFPRGVVQKIADETLTTATDTYLSFGAFTGYAQSVVPLRSIYTGDVAITGGTVSASGTTTLTGTGGVNFTTSGVTVGSTVKANGEVRIVKTVGTTTLTTTQAWGTFSGVTAYKTWTAINLKGTVSVSAGTNTLIGTGTEFLTELAADDVIRIGNKWRRISGVSSDTSATVESNFVSAIAGGSTVTRTNTGLYIPKQGMYLIYANIVFAENSTGYRRIVLEAFVPGTDDLVLYVQDVKPGVNSSGVGDQWLHVAAALDLQPGAIVRVRAYQNSGGNLAVKALSSAYWTGSSIGVFYLGAP